jgi:CubicO group peptidase (beta-lactamase class C family)
VYSDLSFILLGALVEHLTAKPLRGRVGLRYPPLPGTAVATEYCRWRGRLIVGEVHDENAAAMGGVAGHAGAFGTLDAVTAAARAWLGGQHIDVRRCRSTNSAGERFGWGWWLTPTRGLGGPTAGASGFGMSGFVGNRIWLEPEFGYGVVVLSNRIHPVRTERRAFHDWCVCLLDAVARVLR